MSLPQGCGITAPSCGCGRRTAERDGEGPRCGELTRTERWRHLTFPGYPAAFLSLSPAQRCTHTSKVLRSEIFPPPPASPASTNAVQICTNLSQPPSLIISTFGYPEPCRGPPVPLSSRVATPAPCLLVVPTPVSRAGHCLPPSNVSEVFCFLTLPPLRLSYCHCDGSFPAPGPPRCLGSSDHKQNDMKQQYRLTSPLPPGPALARNGKQVKS